MPISAVFLEPATATKQPASGKNRWAVKRKISRRKLCLFSPFTPTTTVSPTTSLGHPTDLETLYNCVSVKTRLLLQPWPSRSTFLKSLASNLRLTPNALAYNCFVLLKILGVFDLDQHWAEWSVFDKQSKSYDFSLKQNSAQHWILRARIWESLM